MNSHSVTTSVTAVSYYSNRRGLADGDYELSLSELILRGRSLKVRHFSVGLVFAAAIVRD